MSYNKKGYRVLRGVVIYIYIFIKSLIKSTLVRGSVKRVGGGVGRGCVRVFIRY